MILVKPMFFRYFRKFLVPTSSTEMTKKYIRYNVKLLDVFDFQGQFLIFCNFLCLGFGKVMGPGTAKYITRAVLFS
jgi:hypothetical protein